MSTNCELHGLSSLIQFEGKMVCRECIAEYELNLKDLEKIGHDTILQIHEAVGRGIKARLDDPEAFDRLKVATKTGLDVVATYNKIVDDVCEKVKMN